MNPTSAWAGGYPVSVTYPPAWHDFQSPAHLRAICALMGVAWEVGPDSPLSIAELGCGTGYTAAVLAAGNPQAQVLGLDYNPAHIAEARSLGLAAGLENLRYDESDLAALSAAELDCMPEFDLVTVHGVWSWVADPVREGVLRLLRRRLKPGGLVMMGYNALPGAASAIGLASVARSALVAAGDGTDGVEAVRQVVKRLIEAEAVHLPPSGWRRLFTDESSKARPGYVLHEFLTEHWRPSFFSDVAAALGTARCEYVGSATIDENFPQMCLSAAQRELWNAAPDEAARELLKDLCVPRAFRRDVYVRGLRRVPRDAAVDAMWMTLAHVKEGPVKLDTQAGVAELPQPLMDAVRGELYKGPRSIAALRALPGCGNVTPPELLAFLIGSGTALPLWRHPGGDHDPSQAVDRAKRFNAITAARLAPFGSGAGQMGLATPFLGGGLAASPLELAVVSLVAETQDPASAGPLDAEALVGQLLPKDSGLDPDMIDNIKRAVALLLVERLSVWRSLGLVAERAPP